MLVPMPLATSDAVTAIVGGAATVLGVAFGGFVTYRVAGEGRRGEEKAQLVRACADYMQATELVAVEIAELPNPTWGERRLDQIPRGRVSFVLSQLLSRLIFGRRHYEVRDLYQRARAELLLVAPTKIIGLVLRVDDQFAEWERERTAAMIKGWVDLRDEIRLTLQVVVDGGRGRPYWVDTTVGVSSAGPWWKRAYRRQREREDRLAGT